MGGGGGGKKRAQKKKGLKKPPPPPPPPLALVTLTFLPSSEEELFFARFEGDDWGESVEVSSYNSLLVPSSWKTRSASVLKDSFAALSVLTRELNSVTRVCVLRT